MLKKELLTGTLAAFMCLMTPAAFAEGAYGGPDKAGAGGKMYEKLDENGDGSVSQAEFLAQASERFAKMDVDGDGVLTKYEAAAFHKSMREKMRGKMQERREKRKSETGSGDNAAQE